MKTEQTNFRLNSQIKYQAYNILDKIGVKPSEAVNMFMSYIAMNKGLPFRPHIPNQETIDAMNEDHKNLKKYKSFKEIREELGIVNK